MYLHIIKYYVTALKYARTFHSNIVCTNILFYFLYKEISMMPWQYYEFHLRFNFYIFFLCQLLCHNALKWKDADCDNQLPLKLQLISYRNIRPTYKWRRKINYNTLYRNTLVKLVGFYVMKNFIQEMMSWRASFLTYCSNLIMKCKVCIINIL